MHLAIVRAFAETASFRLPEAHTFHKTLPLPPQTTLIGILGAALGFTAEGAHQWVEEHHVRMGVAGRHRGQMKDLWKYRKIKTAEVISDVLLREHLIDLTMTLVYAVEDESVAMRIVGGFQNPVYALTAGPSDSLLKVREALLIENAAMTPTTIFQFCVIPGDITGAGCYRPDPAVLRGPIIESVRAPWVAHLPVRFSYEGGRREVGARGPFSFIGNRIHLADPVDAYHVGEEAIAVS
ncbi:MAG: CRISPR-associated protein Cas5 [Nitrospira sp.]|nr:CRISPR-associated protein Cas5 [Nitrospira sp.]MDH5194075.1 CRISPR-associated protein Cas5 [Nitrospira sp.]